MIAVPIPAHRLTGDVPPPPLAGPVRTGPPGGDDHGGHDHHDHPARPFARLWTLLRPEWSDVRLVVLFSLGVGVLSLATPIAVQALVDNIQFGVMLQPLVFLVGALFGCLALVALLTGIEAYLVEYLSQRLFVRVVGDFAHRLPAVRAEAFDTRSGPELVNRFFDVMKIQKAVAVLLADAVNTAIALLVGLVVLALYHQFLLWFALVLLGMVIILLTVAGWGGLRTGLAESHAKYEVAAWLQEVARCPLVFKFAGGHQALARTDALAADWVRARRSHFRVWFRQYGLALFIYVTASTALLGLGGWLVIDRQLTFGQLVAAELIVGLVAVSFLKFGKYFDAWYDLVVGVEKLGVVTDLPTERQVGDPGPATVTGPVAVGAHGAGYDAGGLHSLDPVDLRSAAGSRIGVTGPSGSGKSVLLDLLAGLREPTTGFVTYDGVDLRDLRPEAARARVALVRGPDVFAGTVADNLRVWQPTATAAELTHALAAVGLLDVVRRLPHGMQTPLAGGGAPLSDGQARRLALARALVARPGLLLIDGLLDHLSRADCPGLMDALFAPDAPWTLVVATTDPGVLARCDQVVRLGASG